MAARLSSRTSRNRRRQRRQAGGAIDADRQPGNSPDKLYVVVRIVPARPPFCDTAVTKATQWTQWKIPLSGLTGVNLAKIKKLTVGVGDKNNPVAGGNGRIYIDDIRVTKP